jgi:hypothetical protein
VFRGILAHALIHGMFVALVTTNIWLGLAEFVIHFAIDFFKCEGAYGFNWDQGLHVICKLAWWVFWLALNTNHR